MSTPLVTLLLTCPLVQTEAPDPAPQPYLEAAIQAGRWIASHAKETEHGTTWPTVPAESDAASTNLYSGTPGIVLFLLELGRATGDKRWSELGQSGADELLATLPETVGADGAGLWTGVGGVGFALGHAFRTTGETRYRDGAVRCAELIHGAAVETEHGVRWNGVTDIISGAAGTGLYLLHSGRLLNRPQDTELATRAAHHLFQIGDLSDLGTVPGYDWPMSPTYERRMPNFSHGTAGVATFLAAVYGTTGDEWALIGARGGGAMLTSLADPDHDGFRVYHHTPDGEDLFYLGYCHGPTGTARLFRALAVMDERDNEDWAALEGACAHTLHAAKLDSERTPGFWNNVGPCCGSSGVALFFLAREDRRKADLDYARALADDVLARATRTDEGWSWTQAEHRVRPEFLQAQTGYMQGAAGIGLMLIALEDALAGRPRALRFPDEPF